MRSKFLMLIPLLTFSALGLSQDERVSTSTQIQIEKKFKESGFPPQMLSKKEHLYTQDLMPLRDRFLDDSAVKLDKSHQIDTPIVNGDQYRNPDNGNSLNWLLKNIQQDLRPVGSPTDDQIKDEFKDLNVNDPRVIDLINYANSTEAQECRELIALVSTIDPN